MNKKPPTARAQRVWQRLSEFYGARLADQYGAAIPESWAEVVDAAKDESVRKGLSTIRARNPIYPPTLGEFEAALRSSAPTGQRQPNLMVRLTDYIMQQYPLTQGQRMAAWTWIHTGDPRDRSTDFQLLGVRIPADPKENAPAYKVSVDEVLMGAG